VKFAECCAGSRAFSNSSILQAEEVLQTPALKARRQRGPCR
jgi:hypothetical protein